jgi:hypothetical protein
MEYIVNAYKILAGKPEGKILSAKHRLRWEDIIEMDVKEIRSEDVDWIHLAQDRDQWRVLVNTVMKFRVPYKMGNLLTS